MFNLKQLRQQLKRVNHAKIWWDTALSWLKEAIVFLMKLRCSITVQRAANFVRLILIKGKKIKINIIIYFILI